MGKIINFIKKNWFILIVLILGYFFIRNQLGITSLSSKLPRGIGGRSYDYGDEEPMMAAQESPSLIAKKGIIPPPQSIPPAPDVKDRLVIQNSTLSLLVKSVKSSQKKIIAKAASLGGYMVESKIRSPAGIDSATVIVRVPEKKLNQMLNYIRNLGVRVVSENLIGFDVTDEYVDIKARLDTLLKTKAKFEQILAKAVKIQDILQVQRELINLQSQIDRLKGQQQYLAKSAQTAKITVYLSTDEYSLPYAPVQPWRPQVIFKTAVRSLVSSTRNIASVAIWIVVYSVIWIPALIIYLIWKKKKSAQTP